MKIHALQLHQIPETTGYYSKGHHAHQDFAAALAQCGMQPAGALEWAWWRADPPQAALRQTASPANPHSPGAFPVTVAHRTEAIR